MGDQPVAPTVANRDKVLLALPESSFYGINAGKLEGKENFIARFAEVSCAACDFYLENTPTDGIPYWDTGAPGLAKMGDYLAQSADPYNDFEPVDSSAAAIAAQGFLRLGKFMQSTDDNEASEKYLAAGLTIARSLFKEPYLCADKNHQGLILHSIYHQPNGWDHIPAGSKVAHGESSMWGDYHARELALIILRMAQGKPYYKFFL